VPLDPQIPSSELVSRFLENVRDSVPIGIEQIDVMHRLVEAARGGVTRFLDLGCSEGVLAAAILGEYPAAHGVLIELAEPMLRLAREHLHPYDDRTEFIIADFHQSGWQETIHPPFDAIVSGFALHAVPDARKRILYRELPALLQPEGIFITFEHVASATRWTQSVWDDTIIDAIFGPHLKETPGKPRAEVAREYYRHAAQSGQVPAPLEVQIDWLREAGFENVECFHKMQELAMFGGQRPS
jgi:tRNA (cmo5U34)-methyltransferase